MKEVVAVDLGGTYLRFAHVRNNKILNFSRKETPKSKDMILQELVKGIKDYMNKNVKGIGISIAGPLKDGIIKNSPNLPLKNFDLKKYLQKFYRVKIEVENDANCAALAEASFGVKKKNFFILTLGTGVGGGIIINGELYKGKGYGGELGHIILHNKKDLEYFAGANATRRFIKKHYKKKSVNRDLIKKILHENSSKSKKNRDEIADYVGQGIASLTQVLDPEIVVLAGGMRNLGNSFLNQIKQKAKKYSNTLLLKAPEIKWSKLKHPELIGVSTLID